MMLNGYVWSELSESCFSRGSRGYMGIRYTGFPERVCRSKEKRRKIILQNGDVMWCHGPCCFPGSEEPMLEICVSAVPCWPQNSWTMPLVTTHNGGSWWVYMFESSTLVLTISSLWFNLAQFCLQCGRVTVYTSHYLSFSLSISSISSSSTPYLE